MICYKDKTFCMAECDNLKCDRMLTDEVKANAIKWWESLSLTYLRIVGHSL